MEEFDRIVPGACASIKTNYSSIVQDNTYARSLEEELEFLMESEKALSQPSKTGGNLLTLYSVS